MRSTDSSDPYRVYRFKPTSSNPGIIYLVTAVFEVRADLDRFTLSSRRPPNFFSEFCCILLTM